jgi:hypothetical protein
VAWHPDAGVKSALMLCASQMSEPEARIIGAAA